MNIYPILTMAATKRERFLQKILARIENVADVRDSIISYEQKFQLILRYLSNLKITQLKADLSDMLDQFGITIRECQLIEQYIKAHDMEGLRSIVNLLSVTNPDDIANCVVNIIKDTNNLVQ